MLLYFLDEHKLIQNLPRYVTDNPDNMPTTRLFEGDLSFILFEKFELFDSRIDAIGSALSAMMKEIQQVSHTQVGLSLSEWPVLPTVNTANNHSGARSKTSQRQRGVTSVVNNNNNNTRSEQLFHDGADWATVTSTP